jgi:hypothetical protein
MPKYPRIREQHIAVFGESGSGKTVLASSFYGPTQEKSFSNGFWDLVADDTGLGNRLYKNYVGMRDHADGDVVGVIALGLGELLQVGSKGSVRLRQLLVLAQLMDETIDLTESVIAEALGIAFQVADDFADERANLLTVLTGLAHPVRLEQAVEARDQTIARLAIALDLVLDRPTPATVPLLENREEARLTPAGQALDGQAIGVIELVAGQHADLVAVPSAREFVLGERLIVVEVDESVQQRGLTCLVWTHERDDLAVGIQWTLIAKALEAPNLGANQLHSTS